MLRAYYFKVNHGIKATVMVILDASWLPVYTWSTGLGTGTAK